MLHSLLLIPNITHNPKAFIRIWTNSFVLYKYRLSSCKQHRGPIKVDVDEISSQLSSANRYFEWRSNFSWNCFQNWICVIRFKDVLVSSWQFRCIWKVIRVQFIFRNIYVLCFNQCTRNISDLGNIFPIFRYLLFWSKRNLIDINKY